MASSIVGVADRRTIHAAAREIVQKGLAAMEAIGSEGPVSRVSVNGTQTVVPLPIVRQASMEESESVSPVVGQTSNVPDARTAIQKLTNVKTFLLLA